MGRGYVVQTGSWVEALAAVAPLVLLTLWMLWLLYRPQQPPAGRDDDPRHEDAADGGTRQKGHNATWE